jgi:HEPN domain-containing protein
VTSRDHARLALKAVLSVRDKAYPWTHDVHHLIELLDTGGPSLPEGLRDARRLTPWAAEFRYGETIGDELDRPATRAIVDEVIQWAEAQVDPAEAR